MSSADAMRALVDRIEELEEELQQWQAGEQPEPEADREELERKLETAAKNLEYERNRYKELDRVLKETRASLTEELDKTRHEKRLVKQVELLHADVAEARKQLKAATEVALTFEQKCEIRENKIGDYLCESYKRHEKMQTPWWHVAKDMIKLLGVQFKEIE